MPDLILRLWGDEHGTRFIIGRCGSRYFLTANGRRESLPKADALAWADKYDAAYEGRGRTMHLTWRE